MAKTCLGQIKNFVNFVKSVVVVIAEEVVVVVVFFLKYYRKNVKKQQHDWEGITDRIEACGTNWAWATPGGTDDARIALMVCDAATNVCATGCLMMTILIVIISTWGYEIVVIDFLIYIWFTRLSIMRMRVMTVITVRVLVIGTKTGTREIVIFL